MPLLSDAISGVYETHLSVADLPRSIAFYQDLLGLTLAREIPARGVAFFWVGGPAHGMLGLWQGGQGPLRMTGHFAFRMTREALLQAPATLTALGLTPLGFHAEPVSEPVVIGWMPALSLYVKDPDGHSIEFLHLLDEPPDETFGTGPWSAWCARGQTNLA
jgi:lactoylglutathione lyase